MAATDPALNGAMSWLLGIMLGSAAIAVAVMAVAVFGLLMLSGRIDWRRGARIVIGCFILFGAPVIAAGLLSATGSAPPVTAQLDAPAPPAYQPARSPQPICWTCGPVSPPADPYAGASIHVQTQQRGILQ